MGIMGVNVFRKRDNAATDRGTYPITDLMSTISILKLAFAGSLAEQRQIRHRDNVNAMHNAR